MMSNLKIHGLKCPVCGERFGIVLADGDPGEPAVISLPEYSHPGSAPEVHEIDFTSLEDECGCRENIEMNAPSKMEHEVLKPSREEKIEFILDDRGMYRRVNYQRPAVYLRDTDGKWVMKKVIPLLNAYDQAVYDQLDSFDVTIEEEPYEPPEWDGV